MTSFRIEEMHPEIQRVVLENNIDTGANGGPDGVIDGADLPNIDATLARLDQAGSAQSKQDAALLRSLRPVTSNGLAIPRPDSVGAKVKAAIAFRPTPGDQVVKALSHDDLMAFDVSDRVEAIRHIIQGTGHTGLLGAWTGRVNNERERKVIEILTTTPQHQQGKLLAGLLASPQLISQMERAIDGAESRQFRDVLFNGLWQLDTPGQVAASAHQIGIHSEENLLVLTARLRERRGDAFADQVLTQLVASGDMRALLPYVYWVSPVWSCDNVSDFASEAAWQASLEITRQAHRASFANLLQQLPPGGQAAAMLQQEFDTRHKLARVGAGVSLAACGAQILLKGLTKDN